MGIVDLYNNKVDTYFDRERSDLFHLLNGINRSFERVLDVGCGAGVNAKFFRQLAGINLLVGVEIAHDAAEQARRFYDYVIEDTIESEPLQGENFDLIFCGDVLEHLFDPWKTFKYLCESLVPGGYILVSIPNIRHISILKSLFLQGNFLYEDSGLLDRGHIRFFTRNSVSTLFLENQCEIIRQSPPELNTWKRKIFHFFTLGKYDELLVYQHKVLGQKRLGPPTFMDKRQPQR